MLNPLKRDPTRTTALRLRFIRAMNRKFAALSKLIKELVVDLDAFGLKLKPAAPYIVMIEKQAFRFRTNPTKVKAFRKWLKQQVDAGILMTDEFNRPWVAPYVESAFRKGMTHSYIQIHKSELAKSVDFYEGSQEQFLRDAFAQPEVLQKVELLYERTFTELEGVTAAMDQQLSRTLAGGLAEGKNPATIAHELTRNVANITKTRARMVARTEIIRAHAEGQLDSFERLGVEKVGIRAEWLTAGDGRVCPQCGALEGQVMSVEEARGLIPLHPNCRCAWIPVVEKV